MCWHSEQRNRHSPLTHRSAPPPPFRSFKGHRHRLCDEQANPLLCNEPESKLSLRPSRHKCTANAGVPRTTTEILRNAGGVIVPLSRRRENSSPLWRPRDGSCSAVLGETLRQHMHRVVSRRGSSPPTHRTTTPGAVTDFLRSLHQPHSLPPPPQLPTHAHTPTRTHTFLRPMPFPPCRS